MKLDLISDGASTTEFETKINYTYNSCLLSVTRQVPISDFIVARQEKFLLQQTAQDKELFNAVVLFLEHTMRIVIWNIFGYN